MQIHAEWLTSAASCAVIGALRDAGKSAFFVGGCVRDALLNLPVNDLDIATDSHPADTLEIAIAAGLKAVPTGMDHGTITVIHGTTPFEVTTFRRDVETDGRHAVVAFADNIADDAHRRDFTMNALYADAAGQVYDPLGGLVDLLAHRVRFIDNAAQRIAEDHLRILRFFRFHARYGDPETGLDSDGLAACAAGVDGIAQLSKERIGTEMRKLLATANPAPATAAMVQCGVLRQVLPGADARTLPVLVHLEQQISEQPSWLRRLASLGGEDVKKQLRLSKSEAKALAECRHIATESMQPAEAAFRYGAIVAMNGILLRAALMENTVDPQALSEIQRGATAVFPIKASDLMPDYTDKALGEHLKKLQKHWFDSGLHASRHDLLD